MSDERGVGVQEDGRQEEPDAALLRRHVAGDPEAFATLVRRHQDRLWAVALRTLGDREEAADAVQDALISAYRSAASFRGDAKVTTWLHRIVVNACLDRVRRRQARPSVALPEDDHIADVADPIGAREVSADVERALATLPVEQRAALVLVDVHGYPVDEAAAILEVPVGTVKSRCARGRARLAPLLAASYGRNPQAPQTVSTEHAAMPKEHRPAHGPAPDPTYAGEEVTRHD